MQTLPEIREILQSYNTTKPISRWKKYGDVLWESYGLSFDKLKKIAKQIPKNRTLALKLRQQKNYELKVLSFLIDDPKQIPLQETKRTINTPNLWPLHKIYVSTIFVKLPYAMELAASFRSSSNPLERRYGYSYLPYITKNKKIPDEYFIPIINIITAKLQSEDNYVKNAMNNALYAIGKRSDILREHTLNTVKNIGAIVVDYGSSNAQPTDVVKLLEKEKMKHKLMQS